MRTQRTPVFRRKSVSCGDPGLFGQLGLDAHLLEKRQVFYEHLSFQMIHLMLQADGQQAIAGNRLCFAVQIEVCLLYTSRCV